MRRATSTSRLPLRRQLPGEIDAQPGRRAGDQRDRRGHLGDRRLDDLARLARRLADGQRVDMLHAALDLAPDGVLLVEEAGVVEADEELAVGAVRVLRARHRAGAADVRLVAELGLEVGKLAAAHAGAGRVAALGHEAGDHAVEHDAVVEAFAWPARRSARHGRARGRGAA